MTLLPSSFLGNFGSSKRGGGGGGGEEGCSPPPQQASRVFFGECSD